MSRKKSLEPLAPYSVVRKGSWHYPVIWKDDKLFYFLNTRTGKRVHYHQNAKACYFCANHFNGPTWMLGYEYFVLDEERDER